MNLKFPELTTASGMCRADGCEDPAVARGLCGKHYQRLMKFGDVEATGNPVGKHLEPWDGRCVGCGRSTDEVRFYAGRRCAECWAPVRKAWESDNRAANRKCRAEYAARKHRERRAEVLARYGGRCVCCGERRPEFLAVDHKDGGGNAHRRSLARNGKMVGSSNFYRWLLANGCPDTFQLLCHNCNFAKSHGGCPHERERNEHAFAMD